MYRTSHVRYARIRFDSRRKKSLDGFLQFVTLGFWMFSSLHRSSSKFVIETRRFQGASISPPVVQSGRVLPLALQRRPSAHTFSGSLAGSPVLVCGAECGALPRDAFIRGLPLCQRRSSRWRSTITCTVGSRKIVSRGTGFESPFFAHDTAPSGRRPKPRALRARAQVS